MVHSDSLQVYREQLRHVVRPDNVSERSDSRHAEIHDWDALALIDGLREYAAYHSPTEEYGQIAVAYIEYIQMVVYEEHRSHVRLYAHTDDARRVLLDASNHISNITMSNHVSNVLADELL